MAGCPLLASAGEIASARNKSLRRKGSQFKMLATSGYGDDDVILGGRIEIDKDECAPVYFGFFGHLAEKEVIQARFPRSTLLHIAKQCMHTAHCTQPCGRFCNFF